MFSTRPLPRFETLLGLCFVALPLACTSPDRDSSGDPGEAESEASSSEASTSTSPSTMGSESGAADCEGRVELSAPGVGYVYLDGKYTGLTAPRTLELELGSAQRVGVAVDGGAYYARELVVDEATCTLELGEDDRLEPATWRALWVGIPAAAATVGGSPCETSASAAELDAAFADFEWSLTEHFERYTHQTLSWELTRQDASEVVAVSGSNDYFEVRPGDVPEVWDSVAQGDYDLVVMVWKSRGAGCTIPGPYFGLGWSPQSETRQSGFVSIKFDSEDIASTIAWHHDNDPGVWIHEWLHTIGEAFYQGLGLQLPDPGGDGLVIHGAENYGFTAPWMTWYEEMLGGRVPDEDAATGFVGFGPEAFAGCTVRQHALAPCPPFE